MRPRRRVVLAALALLAALWLPVWWWGNDVLRGWEGSAPSISHGTSASGWMQHGKRLPTAGPNFHTYSRFGSLVGRTAVNSAVRDIVVAAYGVLAREHPGTTFLYGESGFPGGGKFLPHRSHQNGTSADFFVPVVDASGHPATLPIDPWNEWGYWIEFDSTGKWHDYRIDFPTVADHLLALDSIARARGTPVTRVVFAPEFSDELAESPQGRRALASLPWMKTKPWVRHDEHYHVDFGVPTVP